MRAASSHRFVDGGLGVARDAARSSFFARARSAWRELRGIQTSSLSNPADWLLALGGTTRSGAKVNDDTAFNVAAVSACVNILAQSIAMLPLKVLRKTATGAEEATDLALYSLLKRKPGAAQTSYQWRAWCQTCLGLGGNAYSRIFRDRYADVERIEPLKAAEVSVKLLPSGRLVYDVRGAGLLQDYEILHLRGLSSNGYVGRSPLHDMRESLGLAMTAQHFTAGTFANGNRQPGFIKGPLNWTREKAEEFKRFWEANYAGALAAGKNPALFGGVGIFLGRAPEFRTLPPRSTDSRPGPGAGRVVAVADVA